MNKQEFFDEGVVKKEEFTMPSGSRVVLNGLTVEQRSKMSASAKKDSVKTHALVVCMGYDTLAEKDLDKVLAMDGGLISDMSDFILDLSGLSDKEKKDQKTPSKTSSTS